MDKRFLTFLAVAAPIYIGTLLYMEYTKQANTPLQPKGSQTVPEGTPSGSDSASAPTEQSLSPAAPGEGGALPAKAAPVAEAPKRPKGIPSEKVATQSVEIEFSPAGGVPITWNIVDSRYAILHAERRLADENEQGQIPLIDPALEEKEMNRPFEVALRELNSRYYNELNQMVYVISREREEDGSQSIRFESPVGESGLKLTKTYRIPEKGFDAGLTLRFVNQGASKLVFNNAGQGLGITLGPGLGLSPSVTGKGKVTQYSYANGFFRTNGSFVIPSPKKDGAFADPVSVVEWGGLHSRYFMMSLAPDGSSTAGKQFTAARARLDVAAVAANLATPDTLPYYPQIEMYGAPFTLGPGESVEFSYKIFAGPKDLNILKKAHSGADEILFFNSWRLTHALCLILMKALGWFYGWCHSWGLAIILLTVAIRLAIFPIAQIQMKQQAKMMRDQARLKPDLEIINEKYKDDPSKKNQETMKLYQQHGVNPLGAFKGCLWAIIQLPIFVALYRILNQAIDLRGASFLWIDDLSQPDRFYNLGFPIPFTGGQTHLNLLPILTAATQMLVSRITMKASPSTADNPMQKQMMYMMPVMILVITYGFPSGLVLYWLVSNVWQLVQQRFVNQHYLPQPGVSPPPAKA